MKRDNCNCFPVWSIQEGCADCPWLEMQVMNTRGGKNKGLVAGEANAGAKYQTYMYETKEKKQEGKQGILMRGRVESRDGLGHVNGRR